MRRPVRPLAAAVVAATGLLPAVPGVRALLTPVTPTSGLVLAGFGVVLGAVLLVGGGLLYRSDFDSRQVVRIAGWAVLGVVVLGAVGGLVLVYQATMGVAIADPALAGGAILGVSAFAHVLIGVRDAQRIRVRELSREREKLAVLNRLVRHNLRNDTQVILLQADRLEVALEDPEHRRAVATIAETGRTIGSMGETVKQIQQVLGSGSETRPVALPPLATAVAERFREAHPAATIEVDVPGDLAVRAGGSLEEALAELVENAVVHGGDAPTVRVTGARVDGHVALSVEDDGPGIPAEERSVLAGETAITQLNHGSGLGLWLAKWIVEEYDGELAFDGGPAGAVVTMRLEPAAS